ncbi:hypothetical protein [Blastochloris sulfoviridis]|uniref:Cytochrome C n=1 Tax=Blastochloris sulfoviridis TaxID=50712 RepID=A0A5M6HKE3_9HYPH|nr:hypothetical protein [Blastochloris sulfoviridis]KAA5596245.1 hypothetical protein F1193_15850 [Blastochloris sulfoviridis]
MPTLSRRIALGVPLIAGLLTATPLFADGLRVPPVNDPVVAKECASCHMLYPAGLLPARSWTALMASLKDHFGDNAELDADTAKRITDYLVANSADTLPGRRGRDRHSWLGDWWHGERHHDEGRHGERVRWRDDDARDSGRTPAAPATPTVVPTRITELGWFKRKHEKRDRIAPATLKKKGAKFAGDCKACHQDAERGIFEDED